MVRFSSGSAAAAALLALAACADEGGASEGSPFVTNPGGSVNSTEGPGEGGGQADGGMEQAPQPVMDGGGQPAPDMDMDPLIPQI